MAISNSEIRERVQLFSLLRASQRALARCLHPSVLSPLQEHGRHLVIRLQALGETAGADADQLDREEQVAHEQRELVEIDGLLGHQTGQTLEIVAALDFAQLRAAGPNLCSQHSEEVLALLDLILMGDLGRDNNLRLLEYLITMLCSEELNGRRSVACEPSELTPGLREIARQRSTEDSTAAEKVLGDALTSLIRGDDHRELRDELRTYKRELGEGILHPRILASAVAYNVGMWNQVAARIDSTLAIDQLADDLLAELRDGENEIRPALARVATDILASRAFTRLVGALGARIGGAQSSDETATRVVAAFKIDALLPREVEAFESEDESHVNQLICASVVLGCALRHRAEVREGLEALSIEPELLETDGLPSLMQEMTAAASKLFADSRYNEAFEISEVKTRNLTVLARQRARPGARGKAKGGDGTTAEPSGGRAWPRFSFGDSLSPRVLAMIIGPILFIGVAAMLLSRLDGGVAILSPSELAEISPFIESGHHRTREGAERFVGELGPAWDYLGTSERREATREIGERFEALGIKYVVLLGPGPRLMARWENGAIAEIVPKPPR